MYIVTFLLLLGILLTSVFWIIPTYAPPDKKDEIKDFLGLAFPGLLLTMALYETRFSDRTLAIPIAFYLITIGVCVSGYYWWIPKYVPASEQATAKTWLFNSVTIAIIIANSSSKALKPSLKRSLLSQMTSF